MIMKGTVAACVGMLSVSLVASEYSKIFAELEAADIAADRAWDAVKTQQELKARRAELRTKMTAAIGGLPKRTPLNAEIVEIVPRDGYHIEKVLFESRPHFHVPALAYVPDPAKFKAPYPAVIITCGHSFDGKASAGYQRACVMGAKEGFLMLIFEAIEQGERRMTLDSVPWGAHNRIGSVALRMGKTMAGLRIWDCMRAIDYVQSRSDVKKDRIGLMGNSGGGTMTALVAALDPRIKAAAPSCYISNIREVIRVNGPQDAEQILWGQLKDGFNHAGLILMADAAVRMQFSEDDFFPIKGSRETYDVVRRTADRLGLGDRYSATIVPGPHGWKESSRRSSLDWMRQWLMDEKPNGKTDAEYAALDKTFDAKTADMGLPKAESFVVKKGIGSLPGEKSPYDILIDDLIGEKSPRLVFQEREFSKHKFYGSTAAIEENAILCQMLGRNLVEDRKNEILKSARGYAAKGLPKPVLVAMDSWERPAALAYAEHPELFASFRLLGDGQFGLGIRGETKK